MTKVELKHAQKKSKQIADLVAHFDFSQDKEKLPVANVSIMVIDLKKSEHFGFREKEFIYPASLYKIYIAAEVLRQAQADKFSLRKKLRISKVNAVDKKKEVASDPRPLLCAGESAPIANLLDLMLTRSDNTAANCLIDLVDRKNINMHIIKKYGWQGSEITRKFLSRTLEDAVYKEAPITVTCAKHVAEFFQRVEEGTLVNKKVSADLKKLFGQSLTAKKKPLGIPRGARVYRKDGWFKIKLENGAIVRWNSVGAIIETKETSYILAILTVTKAKDAKTTFPIKKLSKEVFALLQE